MTVIGAPHTGVFLPVLPKHLKPLVLLPAVPESIPIDWYGFKLLLPSSIPSHLPRRILRS